MNRDYIRIFFYAVVGGAIAVSFIREYPALMAIVALIILLLVVAIYEWE